MEINRKNYESYFVDYLEGKLDEKLVDDFIEFLQQNPDLKEELSLFGSVSVEAESISYTQKEKLYKQKYDAEEAFNKAAIERLEGDISEEENKNFADYLTRNPEKEKDAALFSHTKLKPDNKVVFNKKQKLYHQSTGKTILLWSARIAAVLVLALVVYFVTDKPANNLLPKDQIASAEKNTKVEEVAPVKEDEKIEETAVQNQNEEKTDENAPVNTTMPVAKKPAPKIIKTQPVNLTIKKTDEDKPIQKRIPIEVPSTINRLVASFETQQPQIALASMHMKSFEIIDQPQVDDERLLADVVKEKTGIDKLSLDKIKKAGLNLVSSFTKDNLSYQTNNNGKITEIKYDSRLLAFSIPTH